MIGKRRQAPFAVAAMVGLTLLMFVVGSMWWLPQNASDWCVLLPERRITHFDASSLAPQREALIDACSASTVLRAFNEAPFNTGAWGDGCRLVKMTSFEGVTVLRVDFRPDGATLTAKRTSNDAVLYGDRVQPVVSTRELSLELARALRRQLDAPDLWTPHHRSDGKDGTTFLLEQRRDGRHQIRSEWSPRATPELAAFVAAVQGLEAAAGPPP